MLGAIYVHTCSLQPSQCSHLLPPAILHPRLLPPALLMPMPFASSLRTILAHKLSLPLPTKRNELHPIPIRSPPPLTAPLSSCPPHPTSLTPHHQPHPIPLPPPLFHPKASIAFIASCRLSPPPHQPVSPSLRPSSSFVCCAGRPFLSFFGAIPLPTSMRAPSTPQVSQAAAFLIRLLNMGVATHSFLMVCSCSHDLQFLHVACSSSYGACAIQKCMGHSRMACKFRP